MNAPDTFPRISLPLTPEEREGASFVEAVLGEAEAQERHVRAAQYRMAVAMMDLGKPIFRGVRKPRRKPTRHVRHIARMRARSLKGAS